MSRRTAEPEQGKAAGRQRHRIAKVTLDERTVVHRNADVEHERAIAIFDLLEENSFAPADIPSGPYNLHLGIEEDRLVLDVRSARGKALGKIALALAPFRRIVKDYFTVCESYYAAIKTASPSRIEAIDMGRRALHDEGSILLQERLAGKVLIDHNTARRLFTLLCVLHIRG